MAYKPGDIVPESGIYSVTHDHNHHQPHDLTCIARKNSRLARHVGITLVLFWNAAGGPVNNREELLMSLERLCPMYDSLYPCQLKNAHSFPWWSGRCQGRRSLAFILTLDTDPTTSTISMGSNLGRTFRDSNHSWKRSSTAKRPKLAP